MARAARTLVVLFVLTLAMLAGNSPTRVYAETLVSLGDSFSSGEAAAPYDADTDNKDGVKRNHKCHRSAYAWPRLLGVRRQHHLACSGATLRDLDRGQVDRPPDDSGQIERLRALAQDTHFDRILLTLGGNDVGFGSRILHCRISEWTCLKNLPKIRAHLERLVPKLTDRYVAIQEAGKAELLVVGYPAIFPAAGAPTRNCGWFTKRSQRRADKLTRMLDKYLEQAARDAGADYVGLRDVLEGHELCTKRSYVQPITSRARDFAADQQQAHPLRPGQLAMAVRVRDWLRKAAARDEQPSPVIECAPVDVPNTPLSPDTSPIRATGIGCEYARNVAYWAYDRCFRVTPQAPCNATRRYHAPGGLQCRQTRTTGFELPVRCHKVSLRLQFEILLD
jgi:hypothetical protein